MMLLGFLFATPLAAALTAAGVMGVPVLLHLLRQQRYQTLEWAAMRFLRQALEQQRRRSRLEHWILLAVRMLAGLLLVLAMAGVMPWAERFWEHWLPGIGFAEQVATRQTIRILALDGSLSMLATQGGTSAWERARTQAIEAVRSAPQGDAFYLYQMGSPGEAIIARPTPSKDAVLRELQAAQPTHSGADLYAAARRIREWLRKHADAGDPVEVLFFTDLQRATWTIPASPSHPLHEVWDQLNNSASVRIVDSSGPPQANSAITRLQLADPVALRNVPTTVQLTLRRWGRTAGVGQSLELWVGRAEDGPTALRRVQQEKLDLPPGAPVERSFPLKLDGVGDYLVEARLVGDDFPLDNVRRLVVQVREQIPALIINGNRSREPSDASSYWLEPALQPFAERDRSARYPAKPRVVTLAQFNDPTIVRPNDYSVIYACDIARFGEAEAAKLAAHVERGGGLCIVPGPNADRENYATVLGPAGKNLLPLRWLGPAKSAGLAQSWSPKPEPDELRRLPLLAFQADADRLALGSARIRAYQRVEPTGPAKPRRLLGLQPNQPNLPAGDPLVLLWENHPGKVLWLACPTAMENSNWPITPTFAPLMQELFNALVPPAQTRVIDAGEAFDVPVTGSPSSLQARWQSAERPDESVALEDAAGGVRFRSRPIPLQGWYGLRVDGSTKPIWHAVNLPATTEEQQAESDLQPVLPGELPGTTIVRSAKALAPVVAGSKAEGSSSESAPPRLRGPWLARYALQGVLILLLVESLLAWRWGSARSAPQASQAPSASKWYDSLATLTIFAAVAALTLGGIWLLRAWWTGDLLYGVPDYFRGAIERTFAADAVATGEGIRLRLGSIPIWSDAADTDAAIWWLIGGAAVVVGLIVAWQDRPQPRPSRAARGALIALRLAAIAACAGFLLPQWRVLYEREGWPEFVVLVDDSLSMGQRDRYADPALQAAAMAVDSNVPTRWQLVQHSLGDASADGWWAALLRRKVKIQVWRCGEQLVQIGSVESLADVARCAEQIERLRPTSPQTRLGDAVRGILQEYRGANLAGILLWSDGVTTQGDDLLKVAPLAARQQVPLWTVGVGEQNEPPDLGLVDLRMESTVQVQDRLVIQARLQVSGRWTDRPIVVTLSERIGDRTRELDRQTVSLSGAASPPIRFTHVPTEPGERTYTLSIPAEPEDGDASNNRIERRVRVSEFKQTRVLLIDGYPRYEYRFLKSLLERESATVIGRPSFTVRTLLMDADADAFRQDRTALPAFPATRDELFANYDAIVWGDVDLADPRWKDEQLRWLREFVEERGGGLVLLVGERSRWSDWKERPIEPLLPVEPIPGEAAEQYREARAELTAAGAAHPMLALKAEEAENLALWQQLPAHRWWLEGVRTKPAAEMLAGYRKDAVWTPAIAQQFVGAGRVIYLGSDEFWRWRQRDAEPYYNQFWIQLLRFAARTRQQNIEMKLDRSVPYRVGEAVQVQLRYPEDRPAPELAQLPPLELERLEPTLGLEARVPLQAVPGQRHRLEANLARLAPGKYRLRYAPPDKPEEALVAGFAVLAPPGELDNPQSDWKQLQSASGQTQGKMVAFPDARKSVEELPEFPRVTLNQQRPPWVLWNQPAVLWCAVGLLAIEWLYRRRWQLL